MTLRAFFAKLKRTDKVLFTSAFLIIIFSLINIYTLEINTQESELFNFKKQLLALGIGIVFMLFLSVLNYRWLKDGAYILYGLGIALIILVLLFGSTIRGTTAWFKIGPFSLQPVEFMKIFCVLALAKFASARFEKIQTLKMIIASGIIVGIPTVLIILQKDFGSSILFFAVWVMFLFLGKIKKRHIAFLSVAFCILIFIGWQSLLAGYQKERILNFVNPERDPLGTGYNVTQSIIAVGSGRILGRGLGLGSQSNLNFLPEQQTDFIFSTIAEGTGIVGATLLLLFVFVLLYRFLKIGKSSKDIFALFAVMGFSVIFFVQIVISVLMNLGLTPVTGLPFPLLSVGGSSLMASLMMIGIAQSIYVHRSDS